MLIENKGLKARSWFLIVTFTISDRFLVEEVHIMTVAETYIYLLKADCGVKFSGLPKPVLRLDKMSFSVCCEVDVGLSNEDREEGIKERGDNVAWVPRT